MFTKFILLILTEGVDRVTQSQFDAIVVTIPAPQMFEIMPLWDNPVSKALNKVNYRSLTCGMFKEPKQKVTANRSRLPFVYV